MKRHCFLMAALLVLLGLLQATPNDGDWEFYRKHHSSQPERFRRKIDDEKAQSFRFLPEISDFTRQADAVVVFEGLPHHTWEAELLKREQQQQRTVSIFGFPFYEEPASLSAEQAAVFRNLLAGTNGFAPLLKAAWCGGFHPDYAIRFTSGDRACNILICNGCGEAAIEFGARKAYCSLKPGWSEALKGFQNKRPPRQSMNTTKSEQIQDTQPATRSGLDSSVSEKPQP